MKELLLMQDLIEGHIGKLGCIHKGGYFHGSF